MSLLRWLRSLVGCPHGTMLRETREGKLWFACADCRYRVLAISRSPEDRKKTTRLRQRLQAKPGTVTHISRRRTG